MNRFFLRIWIPYMICLAASFALLAYGVDRIVHRHVELEDRRLLERTATLMAPRLAEIPLQDQAALAAHCRGQATLAPGIRISVVDGSGRVLADTEHDPATMENHADRPEIQAVLKGDGTGFDTRRSITMNRNFLYLAVPIPRPGDEAGAPAILRLAYPSSELGKELAAIRNGLLGVAALVMLAATLVSFWLARTVAAPLQEMRLAARRYARGDFSVRMMDTSGTEEFQQLAESMNRMADDLDNRIQTIMRQHNQLAAVLAGMAEGIVAINGDGEVVLVNRAAAEIFRLDQEQSLGRTLPQAIRHPELIRLAWAVLRDHREEESELILALDGNETSLHVMASPLRGVGDANPGAILVINDITRLKRLEGLRRDFAANVSHELRTPLTLIQGFAETLLDGAKDDPAACERFLKIIQSHASRLNILIQDLLLLAQVEQTQQAGNCEMASIRLGDVAANVAALYRNKAEKKQIDLVQEGDGEIMVQANALLLEQAVGNLVDNAIAYSPAGSQVRLKLRSEEQKAIVEVADHGCGIAAEHLDRLFERFYRVDRSRSREQGGTGLGLAIAKHIVELHHGRISATSEPGQGSSFTIELPKA